MQYYQRLLEGLATELGFDLHKPWSKLPKKVQQALLHGVGESKVTVRHTNRFGRSRQYTASYEGVLPYLTRRHENAESDKARSSAVIDRFSVVGSTSTSTGTSPIWTIGHRDVDQQTAGTATLIPLERRRGRRGLVRAASARRFALDPEFTITA